MIIYFFVTESNHVFDIQLGQKIYFMIKLYTV